MIDTTEIGVVAAKVMEDIENDVRSGDLPEDARVASVLVVYEVTFETEDERMVRYGCKVTDDRTVLALGLADMAREVVKYGDEE